MAIERCPTSDSLQQVLGGVTAASCPRYCNFHCHTVCSDGSLTPEQLAGQAVALGLGHLAITDHHSDQAYEAASNTLQAFREQGETAPTLWRGVEISAILESCLVHVLALGYQPGVASLQPYLQGQAVSGPALGADAVVAAIHAADGLAILAHPARYRLAFPVLMQGAGQLGFDGVETWYDYEMLPQWRPSPFVCEKVDDLRIELGLLATCGTDTHGHCLSGR